MEEIMRHKDKLKLARKLRTRREHRSIVQPFQCIGWAMRAAGIQQRVARRIKEAQTRKKYRLMSIEKAV